jgi:hypothetical protein
VAYNFQNGKIKKLHMECKIIIQKVLYIVESILQNAKQIQHAYHYFVAPGLKIIGHEKSDNNLESFCIIAVGKLFCYKSTNEMLKFLK